MKRAVAVAASATPGPTARTTGAPPWARRETQTPPPRLSTLTGPRASGAAESRLGTTLTSIVGPCAHDGATSPESPTTVRCAVPPRGSTSAYVGEGASSSACPGFAPTPSSAPSLVQRTRQPPV